jgi:hypothetical protein
VFRDFIEYLIEELNPPSSLTTKEINCVFYHYERDRLNSDGIESHSIERFSNDEEGPKQHNKTSLPIIKAAFYSFFSYTRVSPQLLLSRLEIYPS